MTDARKLVAELMPSGFADIPPFGLREYARQLERGTFVAAAEVFRNLATMLEADR